MIEAAPPPSPSLPIVSADQATVRRQHLDRILADPNLPSPPTLALKIVEKTREEDCRIQDVCDLLLQDPGLCGNVLRTINSPLYGLNRPVGTLNRAVTFLGLRAMRSLVLGLSLPALTRKIEIDQGLRNYWMGSVAGAIMSQELARRDNAPCPEDDLVASLLRDVGMMLLHQTFRESYSAVWNGGDVPFSKQCEWEDENLGVHHAEVGAALLTKWGLPADIVEPIRLHHAEQVPTGHPEAIARRAQILNFTSRLAQLGHLPGNSAFYEEITKTADVQFSMTRPQLSAFLGSINGKIEEFTALLNVDIGSCPNFAGILAAGCEELAWLSMSDTVWPDARERGPQVGTSESVRSKPPRLENIDADRRATHNDLAGSQGWQLSEEFFEALDKGESESAHIGRYEVKGILGRGAMGIVLSAHDHRLGRAVALKVLKPELHASETAHQRFALEGRFASSIRNEHVVTIFEVSEFAGVPFLVMELVEGISVQDHLDANRIFSLAEIIKIGYQSALGVAAAHAMRLIHRDIKPANLLLEDSTQSIRITDFGLVRAIDQDFDISQQGLLVGTPLFMSPEQVDGKPLTTASDLYSIGSVLYTLCTGQVPFKADSLSKLLAAVAHESPPPVRSLNPMIPLWLSRAIEKLHAKNPADRFTSASALAEYLKSSGR